MAPVIWGLDLAEIKWGKFSSKYMFGNRDYHLRRTKLAVYQCALIFCVVSESLGTDVLSSYIDEERYMQTNFRGTGAGRYPDLHINNNDYVGAASYNIWAGVFVAFIFGAAFFFDLIWPERHEIKGVRLAWKITGVLAVIFHLASALTLTIITARNRQYCTGVSEEVCSELFSRTPKHNKYPMVYRHNARAVAAVVFVWLGWVSVAASCVLLFMGINNVEYGLGPKSAHTPGREATHRRANGDLEVAGDTNDVSEKPHESVSTHQAPAQTDGADDSPPYAPPTAEYPPHRQDYGAEPVNAGAATTA